jgi:high-affinity iron transporter
VLVGVVLVVMVGGTALTFQDLGWLPAHQTPFTLPGWLGSWFEMYSSWETLGAQALAAAFVIGSYYLAERLKTVRHAEASQHTATAPAATAELAPTL